MLAYFGLSLVIGVSCGYCLAWLLQAQRSGTSAGKQWLVYAVAMTIVLASAAGIGGVNKTNPPADFIKVLSGLLVAVSFFAAYVLKGKSK
jgi:hypothetical protein